MTEIQINRKEMHDDVISYLDANVEKWTPIPKIGAFKNEFVEVNTAIGEAHAAQHGAKVYVGKSKKQLKITIATKADIINDIVELYATVGGDADLKNKMAKSYSDLKDLRNKEFLVAIDEVIDEVEKHKEVLIPEYGLTEEQIIDLKTDVNAFLAIEGKPRAYKIASVQATKDLDALFLLAKEILDEKLDKAMKIFKNRDTNFYNGYLAARVVVDD